MNDLSIIKSKSQNNSNNLPDWKFAKYRILPIISTIEDNNFLPILYRTDYLENKLSKKVKMIISYYNGSKPIPLNTDILKTWNVSINDVRLSMEYNMGKLLPYTQLTSVTKNDFNFIKVTHPVEIMGSILPFYLPFQYNMKKFLGDTYYMSVPNQENSIFFTKSQLDNYYDKLRPYVIDSYTNSDSSLSTEVFEVSDYGVISFIDD